jgi:hypothetical protein
MATTTITIQVEPEAAKAFAAASPEEQRKMPLLLSLQLQDLTKVQGKPLPAVMEEASARAQRVVSPKRSWGRCGVTSIVCLVTDTNAVVRAALLPYRQEEHHDYPTT